MDSLWVPCYIPEKMNFSLEIGLKSNLDDLPNIKDIYITVLPNEDYKMLLLKQPSLFQKGLMRSLTFLRGLLKI